MTVDEIISAMNIIRGKKWCKDGLKYSQNYFISMNSENLWFSSLRLEYVQWCQKLIAKESFGRQTSIC
jgi:hypothetical protein